MTEAEFQRRNRTKNQPADTKYDNDDNAAGNWRLLQEERTERGRASGVGGMMAQKSAAPAVMAEMEMDVAEGMSFADEVKKPKKSDRIKGKNQAVRAEKKKDTYAMISVPL